MFLFVKGKRRFVCEKGMVASIVATVAVIQGPCPAILISVCVTYLNCNSSRGILSVLFIEKVVTKGMKNKSTVYFITAGGVWFILQCVCVCERDGIAIGRKMLFVWGLQNHFHAEFYSDNLTLIYS